MALDPTTRNFIVSTYPQYAQSIDTLSAIPGFDFFTQGGYDRIASHPSSNQFHQRARRSGLVLIKQTLDKVKLVDNSEKSDESDDSDESDNSDESNESNDSNKDVNPSKKQIDVSNESILLHHSYNARSQTFNYNTRSKTRSQTFGYNTRSKSRSHTFGYNTSSNPGIKKPKSKNPKSKKSKSRKSYKRRKH